MQALVLESFSGPDAVAVRGVPAPDAVGDGAVLVDVRAVAFGPWDVGTVHGGFAGMGGCSTFPQILGWDFAAVRVDDGTRVAAFVAQPWAGDGVAASRAVVPEGALAPVPDGLTDAQAATLGVTAQTAQLALTTAAQTAGAHLLVIGAVAAVGNVVVALARAAGLVVSGSAGAQDADRVRGAGGVPLDRNGDLRTQLDAAGLPTPDAVVDFVGGAAGSAAMALLGEGGRFVSATPSDVPPAARGIEPQVIGVQSDNGVLAALLPRFASGTARPPLRDRRARRGSGILPAFRGRADGGQTRAHALRVGRRNEVARMASLGRP